MAGFNVVNEALQLHGGYGYLKVSSMSATPLTVLSLFILQDYQVERLLRDVRVHQILEGTNEIMSHIVGKALVA